MELERGKLYQTRWGKDWVIAEYGGRTEEPDMHWWHHVKHGTFRTPITVQVRPASPETIAEIERLKSEIKRLGEEQNRVRKQLYELCS